MIPRWACFPLPALLLLAPAFALAQVTDPADAARKAQEAEAAKQQAEAQRTAMQQQAIRDKSIADMKNFLDDPNKFRGIAPNSAAEMQARLSEFQQSIPRFRTATDEYRGAIGVAGKLDKPLKDIATETDVMLRYLELAKKKHPQTDASEFKHYSRTELVWETLTSAERIGTYLDVAVEVEKQDVVAPEMLEFLYKLDGELLRLKWLASHTRG